MLSIKNVNFHNSSRIQNFDVTRHGQSRNHAVPSRTQRAVPKTLDHTLCHRIVDVIKIVNSAKICEIKTVNHQNELVMFKEASCHHTQKPKNQKHKTLKTVCKIC